MNLFEGQYLYKEGESKDSLYIVKDGTLKGTSTHSSQESIYGPGSLIGEFNLLESTPCKETVQVVEEAAIQEIPQETFRAILDEEPGWLSSILTFLTGRFHIAEETNQKNIRIRALPALLYILKSHLEKSQKVFLPAIVKEVQVLVNVKKRRCPGFA